MFRGSFYDSFLFAYDSFIFGGANQEYAERVKDILLLYELGMGVAPEPEKPALFITSISIKN